uniref:Rho-GAP domain-containing protein n=1 Tax=Phlebotomus papatasi TaxID=29031 RepID=A0A1B0FYB8_PHLPP
MDGDTIQPRPIPRPRRNVQQKVPQEEQVKKYENVSLDSGQTIFNITEKSEEVGKKEKNVDELDNPYRNVITEMNNLNLELNKTTEKQMLMESSVVSNEDLKKPIPAPRRNQHPPGEKETGAVSKKPTRKAPGLPTKESQETPIRPARRNSRENPNTKLYPDLDMDNRSLEKSPSSSTLNSSHSSNDNLTKFKTSSPGDIIKSIGATSKLLTESITERVSAKTKGARHKFDKNVQSSRDKLTNWGSETSEKLKNVRAKVIGSGSNFSLGRQEKKSPPFDPDRPQTLPPSDTVFQSIQFNSPLQSKTNNCNDISMAESSYEIPKSKTSLTSGTSGSMDGKNSQSIPGTPKLSGNFERNSNMTQSMVSSMGKGKKPVPVMRIRSESNLCNVQDSDSSSVEGFPCPTDPAPVLKLEPPYGKIKKSHYQDSTESDSESVQVRRREDYENTSIASNRATVDSNEKSLYPRLFSRLASVDSSLEDFYESRRQARAVGESNPNKSDSWTFYDVAANEDEREMSSPEPIYANQEPVYGRLCDMESTKKGIMSPQKVAQMQANRLSGRNPKDIIDEFDPLFAASINENFLNKSNQLILLENLLAEETYGSIDDDNITDDQSLTPDLSDDDNSSVDAVPGPERSDAGASGSGQTGAKRSVIIHQNLRLRSDSLENIVDEAAIEPYLAQVDEDHFAAEGATADLRRPTAPRTNWFVDEAATVRERLAKEQNIDPANKNDLSGGKRAPDKVTKSIPKIPPIDPPSYQEAISSGANQAGSEKKPSAVPAQTPTVQSSGTSMMSRFSNALQKGRINLLRKSSFKSGGKKEVATVLEMIPKPPIIPRGLRHDGYLIRLPSGSGVVKDILKEFQSRYVIMHEQKFSTFLDGSCKAPKETFPLDHVTTIQIVLNHKFSNSTTEKHCFEVTVTTPKSHSSTQALNNPNMVMTTSNSGNTKAQRMCYLYSAPKASERNKWMQRFIESMTDVFPSGVTNDFSRAGWCYLKKSITSQWSGAWILLQHRKLIFYSTADKKLEVMDLRKARCLVLKDSDDSIVNLHVESGPCLMIDCPPFTVYFIMNSPRETKIWRHIVKEEALKNGRLLKHQQLTKDNVPVLIDKCVNFIYAHGSMSEGIYRKSGTENGIQKLLNAFQADAFSVQITRSEYSEHDVANVLKRFIRDLPEPMLGKYTVGFLSISSLKSATEKVDSYKQLLGRLPTIEYQALRKLLGHLNFIQSQKQQNKMSSENLAMIWGSNLLYDKDSTNGEVKYSTQETSTMHDLIIYYKNLFHPTADEVAKEQIMLSVLQKYHATAENLADTVKKSGDLKVWITIVDEKNSDEKQQINVSLTPTKTVHDLCKELAGKINLPPHRVTLSEILLGGDLKRPLHYTENVLNIVLR